MEEQQRDLESLIKFIDFAKANGYTNPKTADNRKRAVKVVFGLVKNVDTSNMTTIDLGNLSSRYSVLAASKTPVATQRGHLDHLKAAIREFNIYLTNPLNYKPESTRRKRVTTSRTTSTKPTEADKPTISEKPPLPEKLSSIEKPPILKDESRIPSLHIDIQVHISPQSSDTQIDKVFESMAKHLKDLYNNTK